MEFENKNLIIISGNKHFQTDSLEELAKKFFGEEIKNEEDIEKAKKIFLSLCKNNALKILEKKESNIFTKNIDKSNLEGNYILVNAVLEKI